MLPKRNYYDFFETIFGWARNRENKRDHLSTGFLVGVFAAVGLAVIAIIVPFIFTKPSLISIAGLLGMIGVIVLMAWFLPAMQFGYKDLGSVIGKPLFKWSALAGFLFMVIGMIILWIFSPYLPPTP